MLKNLLWTAIFIVYFFIEFILRGIYQMFVRSENHLTFHLPLIHVTKYFIIAFIVILFIYRHIDLAPAGKKLFPVFIVISILGTLVTTLWFNAVSDKQITKFRVIWPTVYSWDEVDHVETKVYRKDPISRSSGANQLARLKVYKKYNIHLNDGSVINGWENLQNVYELHQTVLEKNIDVTYNPMDLVSFEQSYTSYFKKDMEKAKFVFYGIKDGE